MPPPFADGLDDWSRGDGTPDSPTYVSTRTARLARNDPHFGCCLELLKTDPVQRVRYMGEVPLRRGRFIEVSARLKALSGPLPRARIATWPGGARAVGVADLPAEGPAQPIFAHDTVVRLSLVIGPAPAPGVELVWDERALYAHVGLDLMGPTGSIVRIERIGVEDVTARFA